MWFIAGGGVQCSTLVTSLFDMGYCSVLLLVTSVFYFGYCSIPIWIRWFSILVTVVFYFGYCSFLIWFLQCSTLVTIVIVVFDFGYLSVLLWLVQCSFGLCSALLWFKLHSNLDIFLCTLLKYPIDFKIKVTLRYLQFPKRKVCIIIIMLYAHCRLNINFLYQCFSIYNLLLH